MISLSFLPRQDRSGTSGNRLLENSPFKAENSPFKAEK